jgi:hypothetical protein
MNKYKITGAVNSEQQRWYRNSQILQVGPKCLLDEKPETTHNAMGSVKLGIIDRQCHCTTTEPPQVKKAKYRCST